ARRLHGVAGAGAAGIVQRAVLIVAEHERTHRAFQVRGVLVADDDEFLVLSAFRFDPALGPSGAIGRAAPLRDDAFEVHLAGTIEHCRAFGLEMLAVAHHAVAVGARDYSFYRGLAF